MNCEHQEDGICRDCAEILHQSLQMRANWIETGDVILSSADVAKRDGIKDRQIEAMRKKIIGLSDEQKELIIRIRRLAKNFMR